MNADEIIKVIDCLIGKTNAIGNTIVDTTRNDRLKILINVTDWCLNGVVRSAENSSCEFSVAQNREIAENALSVWLEWLKDISL